MITNKILDIKKIKIYFKYQNNVKKYFKFLNRFLIYKI